MSIMSYSLWTTGMNKGGMLESERIETGFATMEDAIRLGLELAEEGRAVQFWAEDDADLYGDGMVAMLTNLDLPAGHWDEYHMDDGPRIRLPVGASCPVGREPRTSSASVDKPRRGTTPLC